MEYDIEPPLNKTWITHKIREKNLILADLEFDAPNLKQRRLDLQLSFNPITIPVTIVRREDYYIGTRGAEFTIEINCGEITFSTEARSFDVDYSNEETYSRSVDLTLNAKPDSLESIKYQKSRSRTFKTTFSGRENILELIPTKISSRWILHSTRAEKAVHDYLVGSLHLRADVELQKEDDKLTGQIKIKTSDVSFFDPERRPLSDRNIILLQFYLKVMSGNSGQLIYNKDGFESKFEEL